MDSDVRALCVERAKGHCENCGVETDVLEFHHIVGRHRKSTPLRNNIIETIDNGIMLCCECHRGTNGVHGKNGRKLALKLKRRLQKTYFSRGLAEDEVRRLMGGRLY